MTRKTKTNLIAICIILVLLVIGGINKRNTPYRPLPVESQDQLQSASTTSDLETGESIPFTDSAEYVLLDAKKLPNGNVTTVSRRSSAQSGSTYSYREFQCARGLVRYLGTGDSRKEAEVARFDDPFGKLVEGSSAYSTGKIGCARFGETIVAPL